MGIALSFNPDTPSQPFASLQEALDWLHRRTDYERIRWMPYEEGALHLARMRELLARLGHPHQQLSVVHVAGTKGKGSTSAMIAGILQTAGFSTGLFTSPHLETFQERIRVNGQMATSEDILRLLTLIGPAVENMDRQGTERVPPEKGPTYFEVLTAMALVHFASQRVQATVLEVGLGGRLDATNVCQPLVSVITSISLDHTQQLGNTLESIAREKAGIIKSGVPVVSGVVAPGAQEVIRQVCQSQEASLLELERDFRYRYQPPKNLQAALSLGKMDFEYFGPKDHWQLEGVPLSLVGRHQAANAALALATIAQLRGAGWNISEEACREALAHLDWPARCQVLSRRPTVLVDAAHNVASIEALLAVLEESFSVSKRLLIFGTSRDKDVAGMLTRLLPKFDRVCLTSYLESSRAMPVEELRRLACQIGGREYPCAPTPAEAWKRTQALARPEDLICVTGSFFLVGQILPCILHGRL